MVPVADILPGSLARVIAAAPLTPEKVEFAWRQVAGPAMARATQVRLDGRVLQVRTSTPAWQREIEKAGAILRQRLATLLGPDVVRGFDVTVG
jgi:hypothetical protein